ncbi:MAG: hypothetical protein IPO13_00125 [Rhodocyclaceae bacterium]|nr:hypothetical protein [Rhodocyclaceae bacterium]
MDTINNRAQQAGTVMKLIGWGLLALPAMLLIYPPGFLWGAVSPEMCFVEIGPSHPPSPYDALHPYIFMLIALYVALGILFIRGAKDPKANAALFDFGILSSVLHAGVMIPQSFYYPNEHAHMWADVPLLLAVTVVLWIWHPTRRRKD